MFVDQVTISLKAGDGGNGITAYRRERNMYHLEDQLVATVVRAHQLFLK